MKILILFEYVNRQIGKWTDNGYRNSLPSYKSVKSLFLKRGRKRNREKERQREKLSEEKKWERERQRDRETERQREL